jgi:hypothetical protein
MMASKAMLKKLEDVAFRGLLQRAHDAGMAAVAALNGKVAPMVVEQHANMADDNSPVVKQWIVAGGPCGFAWVQCPANTTFGRWLLKNDSRWRRDSYAGGLCYWISDFGQSITYKEAYASAFARVIREYGIERVYSNSRMD